MDQLNARRVVLRSVEDIHSFETGKDEQRPIELKLSLTKSERDSSSLWLLAKVCNVTSLNLSRSSISDNEALIVAGLLSMPSSPLVCLDIVCNLVSCTGASVLATALRANSALTALSASQNR